MVRLSKPFNIEVWDGKKDSYLIITYQSPARRMHLKLSEGIPKELKEARLAEDRKLQEEMERIERQKEINLRIARERERQKGKIEGAAAKAMAKIEEEIRKRVEREVDEGLPGEKVKGSEMDVSIGEDGEP